MDNKIRIKLNFIQSGMIKDDFSSFASAANTFVYGDKQEHKFMLLFKRLYDNCYDLIAAIDIFTDTFYVSDLGEDRDLFQEFVDFVYEEICSVSYGEYNDIELITPCGAMGTMIDVRFVKSASGKYEIFFDDVQYIANGEFCFFCDNLNRAFTVWNMDGSYVVLEKAHDIYNSPFPPSKAKLTARIKERVKLI